MVSPLDQARGTSASPPCIQLVEKEEEAESVSPQVRLPGSETGETTEGFDSVG
jgi:hypothetical protein